MEEKTVGFQFKARYYKSGTLDARTRQVWIVLHGYGQLAQFFVRKFEGLVKKNICVIAPEGLSRFYLSELTEQGRKDTRVGATWMTREARLIDIENYITFLDEVYHTELDSFPNIPVTLVGFSQGCATVCRWVVNGKIQFERLILWAGIFPPDMDFKEGNRILSARKTFLVVGRQDPYLTGERLKEFEMLENKLGLRSEKVFFNGKHELDEETIISFSG